MHFLSPFFLTSPQAIDLPLKDIHLPSAISWWPLAMGWWLLFGILLAIIIFGAFIFWKWLQPSLRNEAKKALKEIEARYEVHKNANECVTQLSEWLRRVVVSRHSITYAGVTGQEWLLLLDRGLKSPEFSQGVGQILLSAPYQAHVDEQQTNELILICQKWIENYD